MCSRAFYVCLALLCSCIVVYGEHQAWWTTDEVLRTAITVVAGFTVGWSVNKH